MNTKNIYIQPQIEIIEIEAETIMAASNRVDVSSDEITNNDSPLRSRRNFWRDND